MKINADFNQRVVVHSHNLEWKKSPMAGVARRPLDRVGDEVARATSIVRYEPRSHFSAHVHTGGEEFIVLEGVFQDEHGDFPAGSYIRNPPQSKHQPGSDEGCIIFVKLWQFEPNDRTHIRLNTNFMNAVPHRYLPGISVIPLYKDTNEEVSILNIDANTSLKIPETQGTEILVLSGELTENNDILTQHSWLRVPIGKDINAISGTNGAKIWIKQGHLSQVENEIIRVTHSV